MGDFKERVFSGHCQTVANMSSLKLKHHFRRVAQAQDRLNSNIKRRVGSSMVKEPLGIDSCWERECQGFEDAALMS